MIRRNHKCPPKLKNIYTGEVEKCAFSAPYLSDQIRSSGLISFAIIRFRSNLTACGTGRASAIQYRDVRSLTCRNLAALRWLKPSLAIAAPYCWPVMALRFTIIWGFGRMRYRNPRIQVLLLRANDLGFRAETLGFWPCGWKRRFDEPIPLPRGRQLVTLEDARPARPAGNYLTW